MYKKMLAQDTLLYGIGRVMVNVVSFLLLPLYTRVLGKEGYGMLSLFLTLGNLLIVFFRWGLPSAYTRFYFEVEENQKDKLYSTIFWGIILLNIPLIIGIYAFRHTISAFLLKDPSLGYLVCVVTLTTYLSAIHHLPYAWYQTVRQPTKYVIYRILHSSLIVVGNVLALFYFKLGVKGILYANLAVNSLFILIWVHMYIPALKGTIAPQILKGALKFGIPLVFVSLAQWALSMTDKIFLVRYTTIAEVGLYSFGTKIGSIIQLGLIGPFVVAWTPIMFRIAKEKNNMQLYKETLLYWGGILITCASIIAIFSREITTTMGGVDFLPALPVIILTLAGSVFFGLYQFFVYGPSVEKKTHILASLTIIAAILNVCLNFIMVPLWGKIGAALSSLASYLVMCTMLSLRTSIKKQIPLLPISIVGGLIVLLALPALWFVIDNLNLWIKLPIALITILVLLPIYIRAFRSSL